MYWQGVEQMTDELLFASGLLAGRNSLTDACGRKGYWSMSEKYCPCGAFADEPHANTASCYLATERAPAVPGVVTRPVECVRCGGTELEHEDGKPHCGKFTLRTNGGDATHCRHGIPWMKSCNDCWRHIDAESRGASRVDELTAEVERLKAELALEEQSNRSNLAQIEKLREERKFPPANEVAGLLADLVKVRDAVSFSRSKLQGYTLLGLDLTYALARIEAFIRNSGQR